MDSYLAEREKWYITELKKELSDSIKTLSHHTRVPMFDSEALVLVRELKNLCNRIEMNLNNKVK